MFKNTLKTTVLLAAIAGLLVFVGSLFGPTGMYIGLGFGLAVVGFSYWFSDKLAIRSAGATEVTEAQAPQLYGMVRELSTRANIPMPRVYISPSAQPNAFATGRSPSHAAVCVTQGLLNYLTVDEVRGVLAHELGHVKHRDILIGSVAAAVATGIQALAQMAMFAGMFGGGDDEDRPNPLVMLLLALFAPMAAGLLQMALSRSRELEADRAGAELCGDARPLASALRKIEAYAGRLPMDVSPAQASAYIVNPLTGRKMQFANLFMTHPATADRIAKLEAMQPRLARV
ncbi:MAG: zinc metalloprotease HtpX [Acidimicrobiales bacterium]